MTRNPIEEMFEQMMSEMIWGIGSEDMPYGEKRASVILGDADGYRYEQENGDVTEYVLEDGEWSEIDDGGLDAEWIASDGQQTMVADVSGEVRDDFTEASATINNGVLEVEFTVSTDEE